MEKSFLFPFSHSTPKEAPRAVLCSARPPHSPPESNIGERSMCRATCRAWGAIASPFTHLVFGPGERRESHHRHCSSLVPATDELARAPRFCGFLWQNDTSSLHPCILSRLETGEPLRHRICTLDSAAAMPFPVRSSTPCVSFCLSVSRAVPYHPGPSLAIAGDRRPP
jgi:hypothetical protein